MFLKAWRFVALLLTALTMSLAFAHLMEMPAKLTLAWPEYAVVQGIYGAFGAIGSFLEVGAIVAAAVVAALLRKRPFAFRLTAGATAFLIVALMIWFALVAPVNMQFARASAAAPPADWEGLRGRWEYARAVRAVLQILAFAALLLSTVMDTGAAIQQRAGAPERRAA